MARTIELKGNSLANQTQINENNATKTQNCMYSRVIADQMSFSYSISEFLHKKNIAVRYVLWL